MPAFLVLAIMVGYPALIGFWYSLSDKMLGFPKFDFVGLDNYISILGNPTVLMSYVRAFIFSITSVAIKLPLGLGVALLLNQSYRGRGLTRGIVLLPWALPLIVGVLIWVWMYNDLFGVINFLLMKAHITQEPLYFLGAKNLAMPSIILVNVWRGFPFFAVNILAGLQSIPDDLYEAGRVDGATRWQLFYQYHAARPAHSDPGHDAAFLHLDDQRLHDCLHTDRGRPWYCHHDLPRAHLEDGVCWL